MQLMNVTFINLDEVPQIGKELAEIVVIAGLTDSKTKARRLIADGAIKINDQKVKDSYSRLVSLNSGSYFLLQKNKT